MMQTLTCVANPNITRDDALSAISDVCDQQLNICSGINANVTTGAYGAYSVCNVTSRTSFAFNQYYNIQDSGSATCDFNGLAVLQQGSTSQSDTCSDLLRQAGAAGTGTITSIPPGATATRAAGGVGSGSSGNDDRSSTPGLSAGAKAGIGVGAAVAVLALIAVIVLFVLRRRKKRRAAAELHADTAAGTQTEKTPRHTELDGGYSYHEVPASNERPAELSGQHMGELGGGYHAEQQAMLRNRAQEPIPVSPRELE